MSSISSISSGYSEPLAKTKQKGTETETETENENENEKNSSKMPQNQNRKTVQTEKERKKLTESGSKEVVEICFTDDPEENIISGADDEHHTRVYPKRDEIGDKSPRNSSRPQFQTPSVVPTSSHPTISTSFSTPTVKKKTSKNNVNHSNYISKEKKKTFSILRFFKKKDKATHEQEDVNFRRRPSILTGNENPGHIPQSVAELNQHAEGGPSSFKIPSASELPRDIKQILKSIDISQEEMETYLPVILNILTFTTHKHWKTSVKNPFDDTSNYKIDYVPDTEIQSESHFANLEIPEGSKDTFKILQRAGKGGFGTVFEARYKNNSEHKGNLDQKSSSEQKLAIKRMAHVKERDKARNCREVGILKWVQHPNIVTYIDCFTVKEEIWLVMELLEGVSLNSLTGGYSFGEKQMALVIREMLKGIEYLHQRNLIHRDIKSSNVMVCSNGDIKLVDFGLCNHVSVGVRKKIVGSPYWIAPEMLRKQLYGFPVDIWSLGVVLLEMANKRSTNRDPKLKALLRTGIKGVPSFTLEDPKKWTNKFHSFLKSCLSPDPAERSTSNELLQHPFLEKAVPSETLQRYVQTMVMLDLKL